MTIFFTADQHFRHSAIIEYCKRPFSSVEEMDEALIERWNAVVRPADVVYHLGDFSLCGPAAARVYLGALRGVIHLVPGGHDKRWLTKVVQEGTYGILTVEPPLLTKKFNGHTTTLCHWPMLSWAQSHYGAMHYHGHTHGTIGVWSKSGDRLYPAGQGPGGRVDVGVDCWDFAPVALETLQEMYR